MAPNRTPGPLGTDPPLGDDGPGDDSGLLGDGFPPGAVGTEVPVGAGEPEPVSSGSAAPESGDAVELNLVGSYPNPWAGNFARELDQLATKKKWWPGTIDFKGVAGAGSIEVKTAWDFLFAILDAKKPIRRLNFFSHGKTGEISFRGTIAPSGDSVSFDQAEDAHWTQIFGRTKALVDPYAKQWTETETDLRVTVNKRQFSLDEVRAKFVRGAVIWLYVCFGATDPLLTQQVANTFQVTAKGFSLPVVYCVDEVTLKSRKHRLGLQTTKEPMDSCARAVDDFHKLDSDTNVRTTPPKKP
jgi:hypothetical protein